MFDLLIAPETLSVCRLPPSAAIPPWATDGSFFSVTKTGDELSVVCASGQVPNDVLCQAGWRALKVKGPLDFSAVGILSSLLKPLADARIPVFVLSTYDTDYLMVRENLLPDATAALTAAGHRITEVSYSR